VSAHAALGRAPCLSAPELDAINSPTMAAEDDSSTLGVLSAPSELTDFRVREGHLRPPLPDRERPGRARSHDGGFPPLYQLVRSTCALALRRLFGLDVSGLEGLPDKEQLILAANHR